MYIRALLLVIALVKETQEAMFSIFCVMVMVMRSCATRCSSVLRWHRARETVSASWMSSSLIRGGPGSGGAACEGYIATMMVVMTRWMNIRALVLIVAFVKESKQPMLTVLLIVVMVMRSGTA